MALNLLFVEWYIGTAIEIPSGILWRAIAMVKVIPSLILLDDVMNVAIPSDWSYQASRLL